MKFVLLESCWSSAGKGFSGVAQRLLLTGIPAVVAMQYPILISSAEVFFSEFYRCLAVGSTVDEAVSETRKAVYASPYQNCLDWATPTLYMNAPDGVIFSLEEMRPLPERYDVIELYTASDFVGRRREIWTLKKALSSSKRIIVVEGFAGIGKSVLVSRVIRDLLPDFKGVFAVPCAEGYSLDLFFEKLNTFFLANGEGALNVGLPSSEKVPLLLHALQTNKYLIVLDSFEVLLENGIKKEFEFLVESLLKYPHRSKLLMTTRRSFKLLEGRLSGNVEHIDLGGLNLRHSLWLMQRLGIDVSPDDMKRIYGKTGGHPYAIEFIKKLLRKESLERILELPISREDILELLEKVFQKLKPEELAALKQISVLRKPAYIEALEFLASKNKGYIGNLQDKSMIFYDRRTDFYHLHALVREHAYEQLEDKKGAHLKAAKYYEETVEITRDLWDYVEVQYHYFEAAEYKKAGLIVNQMTSALLTWGYWNFLRDLLEKTVETTTNSLQSSCLHSLGIAYQYLGDYEKALKNYEKSLKISEELGDKSSIAKSLYQIGMIKIQQGQKEQALRNLLISLSIFSTLGVPEKRSIEQALTKFIQEFGEKEFKRLSRELEEEIKADVERLGIKR